MARLPSHWYLRVASMRSLIPALVDYIAIRGFVAMQVIQMASAIAASALATS